MFLISSVEIRGKHPLTARVVGNMRATQAKLLQSQALRDIGPLDIALIQTISVAIRLFRAILDRI